MFYFCGSFLPSWIRIRIRNPDPLTQWNPDPQPWYQVKETRQVDHTNPKWDEWVDLEIAVPDIPRFANFFRYWLVPMRCDYTYKRRGGGGREWYRALYDWGPVLWVDLEIAVPDIPRFVNF
jgi:hypothetical protein